MAMTKDMYSSDKNNWRTPPELFKEWDEKYNFTLDPDTGKPAGSPAFGSVIVEFHKSKVYKNVFIEV